MLQWWNGRERERNKNIWNSISLWIDYSINIKFVGMAWTLPLHHHWSWKRKWGKCLCLTRAKPKHSIHSHSHCFRKRLSRALSNTLHERKSGMKKEWICWTLYNNNNNKYIHSIYFTFVSVFCWILLNYLKHLNPSTSAINRPTDPLLFRVLSFCTTFSYISHWAN